ncbi:Transglutaminase-like superfamily protein [Luteitalea pratensis]|uniref:Transglutaminase-like superfamily protein n=2 Tax=Luteitalea pratensis TaxID=1855912 RepID=A0A143PGB1_LUTPR|nr:Transglutaminase-like superfamily protein [Luteitalea pratensis]
MGVMTLSPGMQAASGEHVDLQATPPPITSHSGDPSTQVQGMEVPHAAMRRTVSAWLALDVVGQADLLISLAVASGSYTVDEQLVITHDGQPLAAEEAPMRHGARVHRCRAGSGRIEVRYDATITGRDGPQAVPPADLVEYLRPSRYAECDKLMAFAMDLFGGLQGTDCLRAIEAWVNSRIAYVSGSSDHTDGAVDTLLTRCGVCRDYAHLVIGLLRALAVPARLVACYAPGLSPMDFHAVVEACVDGQWHVLDATRLAPRVTMLRISTGRDAADTAFLSSYGGTVTVVGMEVTATSDGDLPYDDGSLVSMG